MRITNNLISKFSCLPSYCLLCFSRVAGGQLLCIDCEIELPWANQCCIVCGKILDQNLSRCGHCLQKNIYYQSLSCCFYYEAPIINLISQLKYQGDLKVAKLLAQLIAKALPQQRQTNQSWPECIIPMPLHPSRHRQRGFNQAQQIACYLANHLPVKEKIEYCQRIKATPSQTGLTSQERQQNVSGAFSCIKPLPFQHVAILDDVVTTGHTTNALAQSLQSAGVKLIEVWCVARAPLASIPRGPVDLQ